jgi:hypothetical protein
MTSDDIRKQLTIARGALDAIDQGLDPAVPPAGLPPLRVTAGQSIQKAIDTAALTGQDVSIEGASYPGTLLLRGRPAGARTINIIADGAMPLGTRITKAPPVFVVPTPGSNLGIGCDAGASGYTLRGIGISSPGVDGTMFSMDPGGFNATRLEDMPTAITLQGGWLDGGNACHRGVAGNGAGVVVVDSAIIGVMKQGQDTQAFGASNGPGPFRLENNLLMASGENLIFGGDDPKVAGLVPSDIIIRGNLLTKDLAWRTISGTVKNAFELKNARRVLVENNIIEHAWIDGQTGWLVVITVRNQNNTAPWSTIEDVEFCYNVVRHGWNGVSLLGRDDIAKVPGTVNPSVPMSNVRMHHNLVYDLGRPGYGSGTRVGLFLNNGVDLRSFDHNTVSGAISEGLALSTGAAKVPSHAVVTHNVIDEGDYGICTNVPNVVIGAPAWASAVDASSNFDDNLMMKGSSGRRIAYPGAHTRVQPTTLNADKSFTTSPAFVTSDGDSIGADLAALQSRIPGLDVTA